MAEEIGEQQSSRETSGVPLSPEVDRFINSHFWGAVCRSALEKGTPKAYDLAKHRFQTAKRDMGNNVVFTNAAELYRENAGNPVRAITYGGGRTEWDNTKFQQLMEPRARFRSLVLVADDIPFRTALVHIGAVMTGHGAEGLEKMGLLPPGGASKVREFFFSFLEEGTG